MPIPEDARSFSLAGGPATPEICVDWDAGLVMVSGESYPENTYEIYDPLIRWVENYLGSAGRPLQCELHLNYLNTSSIRAIIDVFELLEAACQQQKAVQVIWRYDARNPRAAELGEEFREDYTFPFSILPLDGT